MNKILLFNPRSANNKYRIPNSILNIAASVDGKYDWVIVDGNCEHDPMVKIDSYLSTGEFKYFGFTVMPGPQLRQLKQTVPVDEQTEQVWPGARYGLGVFSRPLPCGGTAWIPSGDQLGYRTRTGVTEDGRRRAVVSMSAQFFDSWDSVIAQDTAARILIDHALCGPH
jgi:hypothetical protein